MSDLKVTAANQLQKVFDTGSKPSISAPMTQIEEKVDQVFTGTIQTISSHPTPSQHSSVTDMSQMRRMLAMVNSLTVNNTIVESRIASGGSRMSPEQILSHLSDTKDRLMETLMGNFFVLPDNTVILSIPNTQAFRITNINIDPKSAQDRFNSLSDDEKKGLHASLNEFPDNSISFDELDTILDAAAEQMVAALLTKYGVTVSSQKRSSEGPSATAENSAKQKSSFMKAQKSENVRGAVLNLNPHSEKSSRAKEQEQLEQEIEEDHIKKEQERKSEYRRAEKKELIEKKELQKEIIKHENETQHQFYTVHQRPSIKRRPSL